jgi:protein-disulfide isomerase
MLPAAVLCLSFACSSGVPSPGVVAKVPIGSSPVRGPSDAWVTMVEFADFECPYCGEEEPVITALLQAYPNDLRLVFKNFPLTGIHPDALGAAIAAECAYEQGDFWPMHDLLYANQSALQSQDLLAFAESAGVDVNAWQSCLSTEPPATAIAADVALATTLDVDATPTFFVNGELVVGAVSRADLEAVVEAKLSQAQASGVARSTYYDTVIDGP